MRTLFLILTSFILFVFTAKSQNSGLSDCPKVKLTVTLLKDTFKVGDDIRLAMTLQNKTKTNQSVWFDKPKSSTGGPAWTVVILTNKKTGKSVLKYQNKAVLSSQIYTTEEVQKFSDHLKPGQIVSGQFSLYDLVVLKNDSYELSKGTYRMQVLYCLSLSNIVSFTVN